MKKTAISVIASITFFLGNANASGIPTIDVAAIAQAVLGYTQTLKDYAEQIKQYEQMVKDTLNFEKQMKEFGVDMNDVYEILGDAQEMINQMQSIYDDVNNIPQDVMKNIARVQTACSFLEKNSSFFGISIKKSSVTIKDKVNRCTYALRDGANISKTIEEITTKMEKTIDPIERANLQTQIDNIKNAERFLQERDNIKRTNMLLSFEDTFNNADKTNPYSRAKMKDDLKKLSKQLGKANNQKQAQALTNSILIKILENLQQQYELNINYTSTIASGRQMSNDANFKNLDENSFKQKVVEYKRNDDLFQPEKRKLPKDELGLPKFMFMNK
ncbi:type IV secretion system protein [Campylobacter ureolyticus]|uniref:type IV secretion system protein n=1 Tax=Campylobacter ureolyticus TaxID=827 RepID=UPI000469C1A2|nr:type IV secretion system protein [Campylobacter ureolyticus]